MRPWLGCFCAAGLVLLIACGGGGGSGGGSTPTPPALSASVSPTQLSVNAGLGDGPPTASLYLTLSAAPTGDLYTQCSALSDTITDVTVNGTGATTATATVTFNTPAAMGVGTFTDTLTMGIFTDSAHTKPIGNSPLKIAVTYTVTAPAGPALASLNPSSATAGGMPFTLTATGSGFTAYSTLQWNGVPLQTSYLSSSQLSAQIGAAALTAPGTAAVTVSNASSGGGTSNALTFTIQAPSFSILSLSPSTASVNGPGFTLTVNGAQFVPASVVQWNGSARPTTFVSSSQLTAQIGASDLTQTGTAAITVLNPSGLSNAATLSIVPPDAVAFQIDPGHTGAIAFPSATLPAASLWTATLDGPPSYPLIAQGLVYVTVPISGAAELVALDQTTGAIVWGPILIGGTCNAAYDSGKILVVSAIGFASGAMMQAFDAATGNQIWSATLPGEYMLDTMPSALGGQVFVTEAGDGITLYAFNEANGALNWSQLTDAGDDGGAAVTATGVYVAGPQEAYAFDPLTGNLLWSNLLGGDGGGGALPVVSSTFAFMPDGFATYNGQTINPTTGALVGSYVADCPPAVTPTNGYFLQQGTLRALALANNQILWSFTGDGALTTSPIVVNGYVFIGSSQGNLYGLDATTGSKLWTQALGAAIPQGATWGHAMPYSGMNAGDGLLIVPAGSTLTAFKLQ